MKKIIFTLVLFQLFAFLYAQNRVLYPELVDQPAVKSTDTENYYAPEISEIFSTGIISDCQHKPRNLTATYNLDCNRAEVTWTAPYVYWENPPSSNLGYPSTRFMSDPFGRNIIADDFDVPEGETWLIEEVYCRGFYKTSMQEFIPPDYIGIEIYTDNGNNLPGTLIYEDPYHTPTGGFQGYFTVVFSEPFIISTPGKYWISIYGTYDDLFNDEANYYIHVSEQLKGAYWCYWDDYFSKWEPQVTSYPSIFFRINGEKIPEPIIYNLYKDGTPIATYTSSTSWFETGNYLEEGHTWSVTIVCEEGEESDPVEVTLAPCQLPCFPVNNLTVDIVESCSKADLTWTASYPEYQFNIYRGDVLIKGNHNETSYTDTEFGEGKHTWKVMVVCGEGESIPVLATKECIGIHDIGLYSFTIIPNPAKNNITISAGTVFHTVEVCNFLGQTVISQPVSGTSVSLNVSQLNNGIYFVRVTSENGISVKKFLKQ